jgi:hypothetical protein
MEEVHKGLANYFLLVVPWGRVGLTLPFVLSHFRGYLARSWNYRLRGENCWLGLDMESFQISDKSMFIADIRTPWILPILHHALLSGLAHH